MSGLRLQARVDERGLDVELSVEPGEVLAVLGPNGAGKSTLLSLVAGLVQPDEGRIELDGQVITDTAARVSVPAHRRGAALLAQQPLLFPHMTAAANVAFAPRSAGRSRKEARAAAQHWLGEVDAVQFAERRPHELSGGQAQRIAVARALAADPRLLMLDEPMSALDVAAAPSLRVLLRRVLRGGERTALVVTHDVLDALALADRVIVMEAGRIVESGGVREVLSRPRSAFAARIAGLDLIAGTPTVDGLRSAAGPEVHGLVDEDCVPGSPAVAVFAPHAVAIHRRTPEGSPRNVFRVTITAIEVRGSTVRVRASDGSGQVDLASDVTASAVADLDLVPGLQVYFVVKATEVAIHAVRVS